MTGRLRLNYAQLNRPWTEEVGGLMLSVQPSPFDVPRTVRFSSRARRWLRPSKRTISFEYLGHEPVITRAALPGLRVVLGQSSHRIYGLNIDIDQVPQQSRSSASEFSSWITKGLRALPKTFRTDLRARNYLLAEEVIHETRDQIFELTKS